jgi:asparagine synthase (glutamine-hydrolysing)
MCGIALIVGPQAHLHQRAFDAMMTAIADRGEVSETDASATALIGTSRLKIVDRDRAVQPWQSSDGMSALCYNGEVFNHSELRDELIAQGHLQVSTSDTEVVLTALLAWQEDALLKFRGEFACALLDRAAQRVFVARDPVGIKPLYFAWRDGHLLIASEVKAFVQMGVRVHELPPGHCGWLQPDGAHSLHPYIDLMELGADEEPLSDAEEALSAVRETIRATVARRVDTDLPVGVILSGGLDSSLVLALATQMHPEVVAFTVGTASSPDLEYATRLATDLGVRHEIVQLKPSDLGPAEVKEAVRVSELTEYGDVINAVVSLAVFERVRDAGVKVVLSGDGSDELFGGYAMYQDIDPTQARRLFLTKIRQLSRTELQRVDRTSMGRQVEVRVPFLDLDMLRLAMRVPLDFKVRDGVEKWIVRQAHTDVLPEYIINRPKNPMSYSSGLHDRVRLFRPMMHRYYRNFGYDCFEPMRRDFDMTLARNDYNLAAATAAASLHEDYTVLEHAKDFAGAVKWNIRHALGV